MNDNVSIINLPKIFAIYYALFQCGYEYYTVERSITHLTKIESFRDKIVEPFFWDTKQNTCEVYPYWPRAFMLEAASFYVCSEGKSFNGFDLLQKRIVLAENISTAEKSFEFWSWLKHFPVALSKVLNSGRFNKYFTDFDSKWIAEQNELHSSQLVSLRKCLAFCNEKYLSQIKEIRIVLTPIKCVFSSDYHIVENKLIFTSGKFSFESVLHEFLHHAVHPAIKPYMDRIIGDKRVFPDIDSTYYLAGDNFGYVNAFEEFAVRLLAKSFVRGEFVEDLDAYIRSLF